MAMTGNNIVSNLESHSVGIETLPISPSSDEISPPLRSLYCETAGGVTFTGLEGVEDTWQVPAGFIIPIAMKKVSAADMVIHGIR